MTLLIALITCYKTGYTLPKDMDIEKIINENSIVVNGLNKMGVKPFSLGKALKNTEESKKTTVWVEGKSLKECIGKDKLINNNAIQCHNGYFKEVE